METSNPKKIPVADIEGAEILIAEEEEQEEEEANESDGQEGVPKGA